ncbi:3'-5' exonuclease family protein [Novosphingobium rosa]|uniref:hypothetical protein n=1 Tax=Novosphingobium rosa TaxID=76978 RepID=UPI00082F8EE9|nr:hypothetical protein [Novosphingobium rosa]
MDFVTIDFEASCLPRHGRSFPIELGISGPQGTLSWLIRPHDSWQGWDWTEEAFAVHGITREQLEREGLAPDLVMAQALRAIGAARVIADSRIDAGWWATLSEASAGQGAAVRIRHVDTLFDEMGATHGQIMAAQTHADLLCPERHRAGADARWLRLLLDRLLEEQPVSAPLVPDDLPVLQPGPVGTGLFA